jgi:hypothetical protein
LNVTSNDQYFDVRFSLNALVDSVAFDPELRILSKNNKVNWSICLPTQEIDNQWLTEISPNPVAHLLTFNFQNSKSEDLDIQIVNAVGQVFYSEKRRSTVGENNMNLNVKELPSGVYFLKLSATERLSSQKFVKL